MNRLTAFCCGRNSASLLRPLVDYLSGQGVPLVLMDDGSLDDSADIGQSLVGQGVTRFVELDYGGNFSMEKQLAAKRDLIAETDTEWVLSIDADEIIEHRDPAQGLLALVDQAEAADSDVVDFDEFVFLPLPDEDRGDGSHRAMRRHYFHQPHPNRLMRMWRKSAGLENVSGGGHRLSGADFRLHPESHNLRHYMFLSQAHAEQKMLGRVYAPHELARQWHSNRMNVSPAQLRLPPAGDARLSWLGEDAPRDGALDRSRPMRGHYWTWEPAA